METPFTNSQAWEVVKLITELRHHQAEITEKLQQLIPGAQITLKVSNVILTDPLPDKLITVEVLNRIYLICPNGVIEYSDKDTILPLDEIKIQLKYKSKKL